MSKVTAKTSATAEAAAAQAAVKKGAPAAKRALNLLLAVVLAVGLMPLPAYAGTAAGDGGGLAAGSAEGLGGQPAVPGGLAAQASTYTTNHLSAGQRLYSGDVIMSNTAYSYIYLDGNQINIIRTTPPHTLQSDCFVSSVSQPASNATNVMLASVVEVTFNANGGSTTPPAVDSYNGGSVTLPSSAGTRSGWTFDGWNTKADGTGTNYSGGGTYDVSSAVTLYARWKRTISFVAGDSTQTVTQYAKNATQGGSVTAPAVPEGKTVGVQVRRQNSDPGTYETAQWAVSTAGWYKAGVVDPDSKAAGSGGSFTPSDTTYYAIASKTAVVNKGPYVESVSAGSVTQYYNPAGSGTFSEVQAPTTTLRSNRWFKWGWVRRDVPVYGASWDSDKYVPRALGIREGDLFTAEDPINCDYLHYMVKHNTMVVFVDTPFELNEGEGSFVIRESDGAFIYPSGGDASNLADMFTYYTTESGARLLARAGYEAVGTAPEDQGGVKRYPQGGIKMQTTHTPTLRPGYTVDGWSYNGERVTSIEPSSDLPDVMFLRPILIENDTAKLHVTYTAGTTNGTYGDVPQGFAGTFGGDALFMGDSAEVSYACAATAASPVGTYDVTPTVTIKDASGANVDSYYRPTTTTKGTYTVNPREVTLTWPFNEAGYTGGAKPCVPTAGNLANGDAVGVTVQYSTSENGTYTSTAPTAAGTYWAKVTGLTGAKASNYKLPSSVTHQFTIEPSAPDYTAPTAAAGLIYTGQPQVLAAAGTATGGTMKYSLARDGAYAEDVPTGTAAGGYDVWYKVEGDANHTSTNPASIHVAIGKAPLAVTANDKAITYGDAPASAGVAYSGLVESDANADGTPKDGVVAGELGYDFTYAQYGQVSDATHSYTITPKGLSAANYDITYADGALTVNPKTVGLTWSGDSFAYDGASHAPTATATGLVNGDAVAVTVAGAQTAASDAAYTATATGLTGEAAGNYALPAEGLQKSFTIGRAALTVTANDKAITYGDAPANAGVTYDGFADGEGPEALSGELAYAYSYEQYGQVSDATHSYTITPSGLTSGNYDITFVPGTLTVDPKEVGIAWGAASFTYNGASHAPTATATGLVNGDEVAVTVAGAQTAASDTAYTATATELTGEKAGNYALPAEGLQKSFTIGRAALTVTANDKAITYGDAPANAGVAYDGFADGEGPEVLGGSLSYAYGYERYGDAGTYAITPSGLTSVNYDIAFVPGELSVGKREVALLWSAPATFTYDGAEKTWPVPEVRNTVNGDELTALWDTASGAATDRATAVGEYRPVVAALSGAKAANYKLPADVTGEWRIVADDFNPVTVSVAGWTYGDEPNAPVVTAAHGVDTATVRYYADAACTGEGSTDVPTQAGTYWARATVPATADYAAGEGTCSFTVAKAHVTVTADDKQSKRGDAAAQPTWSAAGDFAPGEDASALDAYVQAACAAVDTTVAGRYAITAGWKGEGRPANYDVAFVGGTYTVTRSDAHVVATGWSGVYDGTDAGKALTVSVTVGGQPVGTADNVTVYYTDAAAGFSDIVTAEQMQTILTANTGTDEFTTAWNALKANLEGYATASPTYSQSGTHTVHYLVLSDQATPDVIIGSKDVVVSRAPLAVTANAKTIEYGEAPADTGASYSGFVGSEDATILDGTLSFAHSYSQYGDVGVYKITPSGLTSANYDIVFVDGDLTVAPREVGLEWPAESSFEYDGTEKTYGAPTLTRVVDGDDVAIGAVSGDKATLAGSYTAAVESLTGAKASNYKLPADRTHSWSIGLAANNVTVALEGWTYGEAANAPVVTATFGADTAIIEYADAEAGPWSAAVSTDAGTHWVRATVPGTTDYAEGSAQATFSIAQREAGISWDGAALTYDGTPQAPAATATGLVRGDACSVTVGGAQTAAGGPYTATATGLSNANYKLPADVTATFSIAKRAATVTARGQAVSLEAGIDTTPAAAELSGGVEGHALSAVTITRDPASGITFAGTVTPSAASIADAHGADVTVNYELSYEPGALVVHAGSSASPDGATEIAARDFSLSIDEARAFANAYAFSTEGRAAAVASLAARACAHAWLAADPAQSVAIVDAAGLGTERGAYQVTFATAGEGDAVARITVKATVTDAAAIGDDPSIPAEERVHEGIAANSFAVQKGADPLSFADAAPLANVRAWDTLTGDAITEGLAMVPDPATRDEVGEQDVVFTTGTAGGPSVTVKMAVRDHVAVDPDPWVDPGTDPAVQRQDQISANDFVLQKADVAGKPAAEVEALVRAASHAAAVDLLSGENRDGDITVTLPGSLTAADPALGPHAVAFATGHGASIEVTCTLVDAVGSDDPANPTVSISASGFDVAKDAAVNAETFKRLSGVRAWREPGGAAIDSANITLEGADSISTAESGAFPVTFKVAENGKSATVTVSMTVCDKQTEDPGLHESASANDFHVKASETPVDAETAIGLARARVRNTQTNAELVPVAQMDDYEANSAKVGAYDVTFASPTAGGPSVTVKAHVVSDTGEVSDPDGAWEERIWAYDAALSVAEVQDAASGALEELLVARCAAAAKDLVSNRALPVTVRAHNVQAAAGTYAVTFQTQHGAKASARVTVADVVARNDGSTDPAVTGGTDAVAASGFTVKKGDQLPAGSDALKAATRAKAWDESTHADRTADLTLAVVDPDPDFTATVGVKPLALTTGSSTDPTIGLTVPVTVVDEVDERDGMRVWANDFTLSLDQARAKDPEAIIRAAQAGARDLNADAAVTPEVDASALQPQPGVYEVAFSAGEARVTVECRVCDHIVVNPALDEAISADDFTLECRASAEAPSADLIIAAAHARGWKPTDGSPLAVEVALPSGIDWTAKGAYDVVFKVSDETSVTARMTLDDGVVVDPPYCLAANGCALTVDEAADVVAGDDALLVERAHARGWLEEDYSPVAVEVADKSALKAERGDYKVAFRAGTAVKEVTVYVRDVVVYDPQTHEVIAANDFFVALGENLTDAGAIARAKAAAWAWSADTGEPVDVTRVDLSAVDTSAKGDYPATFATDAGTSVTVTATVRDHASRSADGKQGISADDFSVASNEVAALDDARVLELSGATGWVVESGAAVPVSVTDRTAIKTAPGTYPVTLRTPGNAEMTVRATVTAVDVTDDEKLVVTVPDVEIGDDGKPVEPKPVVAYDGVPLVEGVDYDVTYSGNDKPGTATATITFKGAWAGKRTATFEVKPPAVIDVTGSDKLKVGAVAAQDYAAKGVEPKLQVSYDGKALAAGTDYDVAYEGNVEVGTAKATLTFKGAYKGTASTTFEIGHIADKQGFEDLEAGAWYLSEGEGKGSFAGIRTLYMDFAFARGLMTGYRNADGTFTRFGPDDNVQRAQVATILYRIAQPESSATTDPAAYAAENKTGLPDVEPGQYYTAAVNWAQENGIVTGYGENGNYYAFGPYDDVTREQMATMIARFCTVYYGKQVKSADLGYEDAGSISGWATKSVAYCKATGIMAGYTGTGFFGPQDPATRCQAAKIVSVAVRDVIEADGAPVAAQSAQAAGTASLKNV